MPDVPITVDGEPLAFERRPDEGPEAWDAFVKYRDMGTDRSIRGLARALSKSATLLAGWSSRHEWQRRTFEYDTWLEKQHRNAMQLAIVKRGEQHAQVLDAMITSLAQPALALAARIEQDGGLKIPEDADPAQFLAMVAETAKVMPRLIEASRLVNGMSTENVQHSDAPSRAELKSDDEVEDYLIGVDDGTLELTEGEDTTDGEA